MKNLLFAFLMFVVAAATCSNTILAQKLEPVKWLQSVEKLDDGNIQVNFTATLDEGWYIYSQTLEEGGPIPTSIEFDENVEIIGEIQEAGELKEGFDDMFEINIRKYAQTVVFTAILKPSNSEINQTNASVRFMCCDNMRCLPPSTVDFDVKF